MNIIFWLIIIVVLILFWFCLSFAFKTIGGIGLKLFDDAKHEIICKEKKNENNQTIKEETNNER